MAISELDKYQRLDNRRLKMITQIVQYTLDAIMSEITNPDGREAVYAIVKLMALSGNEEANELVVHMHRQYSYNLMDNGTRILDKAMIMANDRVTMIEEELKAKQRREEEYNAWIAGSYNPLG